MLVWWCCYTESKEAWTDVNLNLFLQPFGSRLHNQSVTMTTMWYQKVLPPVLLVERTTSKPLLEPSGLQHKMELFIQIFNVIISIYHHVLYSDEIPVSIWHSAAICSSHREPEVLGLSLKTREAPNKKNSQRRDTPASIFLIFIRLSSHCGHHAETW